MKLFLLFIPFILQASWCDVCGRVLQKNHPTLTLPNGQTRNYDCLECEAKDIKKYGFKKDINITKADIEKHDRYWMKIKRKKLYKIGHKIYHDRCAKDIDLDMYLDISDLEKDLKSEYCKNLSDERVYLVATYLWDKFHHSLVEENTNRIKVTKDEKCPVCGMLVYKYPRWAAQIFLPDGSHLSFDGVKDMTKYMDAHKIPIKKILVTDYYTQKAIDGRKAFYVIGSDTYGPMGHEAIPFEGEDEAKKFMTDHRGKKILKLNEVHF